MNLRIDHFVSVHRSVDVAERSDLHHQFVGQDKPCETAIDNLNRFNCMLIGEVMVIAVSHFEAFYRMGEYSMYIRV